MNQDRIGSDAPLDSLELMKVVMQADEETRAFALRGTTNWAAYIGKAVQRAVIAATPPADRAQEDAHALLQDVAACFTRDDDLPDNLLPRIDSVLAARKQGGA